MSAGRNGEDADVEITQAALDYHAKPRPGKISNENAPILIKKRVGNAAAIPIIGSESRCASLAGLSYCLNPEVRPDV